MIELKNIRNTSLTIKDSSIISLFGLDIHLTNEIYDYISKYYGNFKYDDDSLKKYNYLYPEIKINDELSGRDDYIFIGINTFTDLDIILENKKDKIIYQYSKNIMQNIDVQIEIENISSSFYKIIETIESELHHENIINFIEPIINADTILQKNICINIPIYKTNIEKLNEIYLILNELINISDVKYILYLNNLERLITLEEYNEFISKVEIDSRIKIIIQTNDASYLNFNELEKINYIYEDKIDTLITLDELLNKLNMNYYRNKEFNKIHLIDWLNNNFERLIKREVYLEKDINIYNALVCKDKREESIDVIKLENSIII